MNLEQIKAVKRKYEAKWLKLPSVISVGIAVLDDGIMGIIVSIKSPDDSVRANIPEKVEGVTVEIKISGTIEAQ